MHREHTRIPCCSERHALHMAHTQVSYSNALSISLAPAAVRVTASYCASKNASCLWYHRAMARQAACQVRHTQSTPKSRGKHIHNTAAHLFVTLNSMARRISSGAGGMTPAGMRCIDITTKPSSSCIR